MITCIGTGGHARALELPDGTAYANATEDDILSGRFEVPDLVVLGVGYAHRQHKDRRPRLVAALRKMRPDVEFPSWSLDCSMYEHDGLGRQFLHRVHVGPGVTVGEFATINTGAILEHDVRVGAYSHVCPGAILCGGVVVGERCLIGAGAVVLPGVVIPDDEIIGAMVVRKA